MWKSGKGLNPFPLPNDQSLRKVLLPQGSMRCVAFQRFKTMLMAARLTDWFLRARSLMRSPVVNSCGRSARSEEAAPLSVCASMAPVANASISSPQSSI